MNDTKRKLDDRTYLKYLFQSLNVTKLKDICRVHKIKGYSRYSKQDLIEFILDSLSEEEIGALIKKKELEIISEGINSALQKINGEDRESISSINIVNPERHEIEFQFKGFNWETESYLLINESNIDNPERDCDCRIGANMGFCGHFWVGIIFALKKGYLDLSDWSLTDLPENFDRNLKSINISKLEGSKEVRLIDKSSDDYLFQKFLDKSITIYGAEVENVEEKEQMFQENVTIYYLAKLKEVKLGPRVKKKSDMDEDEITNFDEIYIRISQRLQEENDFKPGDKIKLNGKLTKDNFLKKFIVKNIRKITILK